KRGGEVDGAEDDHRRRRREGLDEDLHVALARLAVRAVVPRACQAGLELGAGVTPHDAVEAAITKLSELLTLRSHEQLGAWLRSVDDGRERDRFLRPQQVAQLLIDRRGHQSSGSTKRWIVPPHVSPTANASS